MTDQRTEYKQILSQIKIFMEEQGYLRQTVEAMCRSSFCVVDIGNRLLDDYIRLAEHRLNLTDNWLSWFAFENEFGKKELEVVIEGKPYVIANEEDFFEVIVKN